MKHCLIIFSLLLNTAVQAQQLAPSTNTAPISLAIPAMDIDAAIKGDWRSDVNKARDGYRHPAQTLAFFGIKPDMTVLEITPGAGWYTEILAPALKRTGKYIAALQRDPDDEDKRAAKIWLDKVATDPQHFGMVNVVEFSNLTPGFGSPASVDAVLTFRNVHNWESIGTTKAMFHAFFDVLKPGGVLGVVDHRAKTDSDPKSSVNGGYLPQAYVIRMATDAGFVLSASSEINANAKDTKDYVAGVWALPPTLAMGKNDRDKLIAIGESDRMTLRFVKPPNTK